MFEAVRSNRIIVQVILGLIVLTFAFFGIESYLGSIGNDNSVATVGQTKIGPAEFENALRQQQDRIRQQSGGQVEISQLNTPAIREAVLEGLVSQRLLALYAAESRLSVSAHQLREVIGSIDEFKEAGQFSRARYEQVLRSQGLSEPAFEAQLRRDVAFQQITTALGTSALAAKRTAAKLLDLQLEERTVALGSLDVAQLAAGMKVSDDDVEKYYRDNARQFQRPPSVKVAFVELDRKQLGAKIQPPEGQARSWYEAHPERYRQDEERQARHILIELPADAAASAVDAAMAKAQGILARLRESGGKNFEELARKESQDPGSAPMGGDLGFFTRGMMVKAFEDAAFGLPVGEISDVVRSDFGLHIIQVTAIRPEKVKSFDEVRPAIESELREQEVHRHFAEAAESFANLAYEQPDSLQPLADQFGLAIQTTDWMAQGGEHKPPFDNRRLLDALFSPEALERKLNTEAVDVGDGRLVSARVADFRAAEIPPIAEVHAEIVSILQKQAAQKQALEKGQAIVTALRDGKPVDLKLAPAIKMTRRSSDVDGAVVRAVFSTPTSTVPAYGGAVGGDGSYHVFRIEAVETPKVADDDPRLGALRGQYERMLAERDMKAFLAELRRKYGVEINRAVLKSVAS